MAIGSSNVPLRYERKGRGAMPSRAAGRDGASEAEAPLRLWVAIWLCSVVYDHQDFKLWGIVPPLFP